MAKKKFGNIEQRLKIYKTEKQNIILFKLKPPKEENRKNGADILFENIMADNLHKFSMKKFT